MSYTKTVSCGTCGLEMKGVHGGKKFCSERCRKAQYRRPCPKCGVLMDASRGYSGTPRRCATCAAQDQHEERYWTPERVCEALRAWAKDLGRTPRSYEASLAGARVDQSTVSRELGSWNAGLIAAGLEPNELHAVGDEFRALSAEARTLHEGGLSVGEIARKQGVGPSAIRNRLAAAGVAEFAAYRAAK